MEEVDKLIETMAKKIKEDIILGRNTDKLAERVTALAELISARAVMFERVKQKGEWREWMRKKRKQ